MRDLALAVALSPVLILQALWVMLRASRLPEAAGPRTGQIGQGPLLRLLVVGDSSAAGVGVADQTQALAGQIAALLAGRFEVNWQVIARSGGTAKSTLSLLDEIPPEPCDVAVIALGVNDSKNGVTNAAWRRDYSALTARLQDQHGAKNIYTSALPELGNFPLLPWPLSAVLGKRATLLDASLREIASVQDAVHYAPLAHPLPTTAMASDGFHPGAEAYTEWAGFITPLILRDQTP